MASAFKVGDRIVMLHNGQIIFDGTPDEVKRSDHAIVRRFVTGEADQEELQTLKL
jgi:ABC-type transporter Mla maintaining outer membrane lipid asymmetry ATPase subunit MlaF